MSPDVRPVEIEATDVASVIKTDRQARARARVLWGMNGFADTSCGRIGVRFRVGITSGTTKIVYANGCSWDEAFERASAGEESYSMILKRK
jgi:hypothetical protein